MTLRARINLFAAGLILLVVVCLLATGRMVLGESENRFHDATIIGKKVLWQKIISSELESMNAGTTALSRDRDTIQALKSGNRDELKRNAITTYNLLSASNVITKLEVTDLNGSILFASPHDTAGITKKALVHQALKEGRVMRGIERDDDGQLVATVSFPLYALGKPVGAGVFARNLQDALDDFKRNDESDAFILAADGRAEYATDQQLFQSVDGHNLKISEGFEVIAAGDRTFAGVFLPVLDANGQPLARLVSLKDQSDSYHRQSLIETLSYVGVIALLAGALGGLYWYLRRSFAPLASTVIVMNRIARGDLTGDVQVTSNDEIGQLLTAMRTMRDGLSDIVTKVHNGAHNIAQSAAEISAGNENLAQRTEEQASSLEETAASMEELTGTVKHNADNSRDAKQLANNAREAAEKGGNVVAEAVTAMAEINSASRKVSDIISVIDEIAFQTNLLALNAAVEAARAGEQGRGFAVVAAEVRNLAQRSAASAKEIKGLITDSVEKIADGSRLVDQSGQTLKEIVESVKKVSDIVADMAAATLEQSGGIEQVNQAISQMDQITQHNAALVEEAAAASKSMAEQAQAMTQVVSTFKLGKEAKPIVAATERERSPMAVMTTDKRATTTKPANKGDERTAERMAGRIVPLTPAAPRQKASGNNAADWQEF